MNMQSLLFEGQEENESQVFRMLNSNEHIYNEVEQSLAPWLNKSSHLLHQCVFSSKYRSKTH